MLSKEYVTGMIENGLVMIEGQEFSTDHFCSVTIKGRKMLCERIRRTYPRKENTTHCSFPNFLLEGVGTICV